MHLAGLPDALRAVGVAESPTSLATIRAGAASAARLEATGDTFVNVNGRIDSLGRCHGDTGEEGNGGENGGDLHCGL